MLALDRAVRQGLDVSTLFTIYEGNTGRLRFHGVRRELIEAQAKALGRDLVLERTHPDDYEVALGRALDELKGRGIDSIAFGNIHLTDIRAWYEQRTSARGFRHVEPLWGGDPADLVAEFLDRGYRTRIVSVNLEIGPVDWLGETLSPDHMARVSADEGTADSPAMDPAGERGEYHTFVYDGPLFERPVAHEVGEAMEREGHRFVELASPTPAS